MKSLNRKLQAYNDGVSMSAFHNLPSSASPPSREPIFTQSAPPPQQQYQKQIAAFDSSMALTVLVLFTVLFFMGFFSIYIRRFSDDPAPINNSRNHRRRLQDPPNIYPFNSVRKGLDPEIIRSLPLLYYHKDAKYQIIDCAICLGEMEEGEVVKMIPYCRHVFHVECIDRWLSIHATCPVCRGNHFSEAECSGGNGGGCLLLVVDRVAEVTVDHDVSEFQGRSTVGNANTCDDVTGEMASMGIRRSCSWTVLNVRAPLQRTRSF